MATNNAPSTAVSSIANPAASSASNAGLVGSRLPYGYVLTFNGSSNYTPASSAGTIGPANTQEITINPNADFELVKLSKYDTGGGRGLISFSMNSRELFFGSVYGGNIAPNFAGINTVFGNGGTPSVFEKPYILPANRSLVGSYEDTSGTAGQLYCLFMGNNVFPSASYISSNSNLVKTTVTKKMQPVIYPISFRITQANQQLSGRIVISQGENFIFQGIAIDDSMYPVLINYTFSQYGNTPLFSAPIPTRMINGTYITNNNANNITTDGVKLFRLPSYINLASQTSINISVQDFLGQSDYLVHVSLYGVASSQS